jgi:hypothetical protein
MKTRQENRLNMYNNVISIFEKFTTVIAAFLQLKDSVTRFKNIIQKINKTIIEQEAEISGITLAKQNLRLSLIHMLAITAAALKVFAHKNHNMELEGEVDLSENAISKLSDILLIEKSNLILTRANTYALQLVDFGIDASELVTLASTIDSFELQYNNPVIAIERSKYFTELLATLFSETNDILFNELDPLMLVISDEQAEFYNLFKNARNIIDRHGKSRKQLIAEGIATVTLNVSATIDDSPREGALVELLINDVVTSTVDVDELGEAYFEAVPAGLCSFRVSQETFTTKQTAPITIQPGDELTLDIQLDASLE